MSIDDNIVESIVDCSERHIRNYIAFNVELIPERSINSNNVWVSLEVGKGSRQKVEILGGSSCDRDGTLGSDFYNKGPRSSKLMNEGDVVSLCLG